MFSRIMLSTFRDEPEETEEQIKQKVRSLAKKVREMLEKINHGEFIKLLENLEKNPNFLNNEENEI
jgi:hypothetical protein